MSDKKFTQLPAVLSAQLTDVICAVQGGVSSQETLQQIYNLFLTNTILSNSGNPNGSLAGRVYQLCFDTTNNILYICTATGNSSTAVWEKAMELVAGTGISISQSGNTVTISASGSGMGWNEITTTTDNMLPNNGYIANNGGLVTLSLPSTANVGDVIYIVGKGSGGWKVGQAAGQQIIMGSSATTIGAGGSIASTNQYDSIALVCTIANTTWTVLGGPQGIITIV